MKSCMKNSILIAFIVLAATPAYAQRRVPASESAAIGGDVGIFVPRDAAFNTGPVLEGFYEYYLSPRASVRLGMGWAKPKLERESADSLRHVRIATDAVYNREGGAIHPFAGAGIGVYFLQFKDNGHNAGDSETKFGATVFGGAEFFTTRRTAVKAEARYHLIENIGATNPDGFALTIGVKGYF
jgi:hypothetical protein